MVLGLRGFPDVEGGVETHAEQLYTEILQLAEGEDTEIEALVRSPYAHCLDDKRIAEFGGRLRMKSLYAPQAKGVEAMVHSIIGVFYAAIKRPDVLHIHAVGPGLVVPMARLLGLNVVFTHHGPDYEREKWGAFAKRLLSIGEHFGARWANETIVISQYIQALVKRKHQRESMIIPNGVILPDQHEIALPADLDITSGRYVLMVSRIVPEKRQNDLIKAFQQANLASDWKLVLVGADNGQDRYSSSIREMASQVPGVVLTGFRTGDELQALYQHAGMFVLPSSHEGLPIAMLEALSHGLPVIASDIPANVEVGLAEDAYFELGDIQRLSERIRSIAVTHHDPSARRAIRAWVNEKYNWTNIAAQTLEVFRRATV